MAEELAAANANPVPVTAPVTAPVVVDPAADAAAVAAAIAAKNAPVVPPVVQPTAEEVAAKAAADEAAKKATLENKEPVTYAKTGDTSLDAALEFVGKLGLLPDHPAMVAAGAGNFDLLRAHFAQNPVAGWETMVKIGEDGFKRFLAANAEKELADLAKAHELAGGEEQFNEALAWANANAEPAEKEQFNAMMQQGGFAADAALFYIINQHKATLQTIEPAPAVDTTRAGNSGSNAASGQRISRVEFATESRKLFNRMGDAYINSPEYAALGRRLIK